MDRVVTKFLRAASCYGFVLLLAGASLTFAQDQQNTVPPTQEQTSQGWHRFSGPPPAPPASSQNQNSSNPYQPYGPADKQQGPTVPTHLTIPKGAYITVRTNQMLSSNSNVPGDAFTATLEKPLVVDGLVVAERGETLGGRVVEAKKGGRIKGVSHLAVQLTNVTLVDGQQMPIQTRFMSQAGPTSRGRDAGAITTTTALGAAVGAAANGGIGAAVGAGAGAIAGTVGVLVTRGHPAIIYPESLLTFQLEDPVRFSTARAPEAFHYVVLDAFAQSAQPENPSSAPRSLCNGRGCAPPPYYYGPLYYSYFGPPFYPYYFGPTFYFGRFGFHGRR